ncbi:MAG TPA: LUD domain-containing protein [Acidimicrobiales bacterium]
MEVTEVGDRAAFLAKARERLSGGIHVNPVHVPPEPTAVPPEVRFTALDLDDLVGSFVAMATEVDAVVHRVDADGVGAKVLDLARQYGAATVVRSAELDLEPVAAALSSAGVTVDRYDPATGAAADVGLTGAVAGVAATGSLVLDASTAGSRAAGLLPPVHIGVLREDQLVATPADVLHPLAAGAPSSLVLVGGPSRTGDVEQILTLGVHGPRHVHIVLVAPPRSGT